jgi:16S rRNA C967 or C1407 C5-methylase (RsmB/RsmF family)
MEGQLVDSMADRAYNRQLSRANRLWSEYARAREDSNSSTQAGIGMLVGGGMTALDMASGGGPKTADAATRMRRREADGFERMSPIQSQIPTAPLPPLSPLGYNP